MVEGVPGVRWLDAVPSTQEVAHLLAESGSVHGTAVAAREQLAGRGTRGRTWHSPLGGLWLSVLCRPQDAASAECFSLRVGLAVAGALEAALPDLPPLRLKWPNDLFLNGRKVGGILCEARWQGGSLAWIVAGIGINVRNPIPPEVAGTAIALAAVVPSATPEQLAAPVASRVAADASAGGTLTDGELASFGRRDWLRGRAIREPVAGIAQGIDRDGALLVETSPGRLEPALGGTVVLATDGVRQ